VRGQWLDNRRPLEPMEMLECGALTNHKHDFVGVWPIQRK
jgi:hypothetical protein